MNHRPVRAGFGAAAGWRRKVEALFPRAIAGAPNVGAELAIRCDNCPEDLKAAVSFVSNEPEFTPPVIYSLENRQKLVFLVEAKETGGKNVLKPGQIVDADLIDGKP